MLECIVGAEQPCGLVSWRGMEGKQLDFANSLVRYKKRFSYLSESYEVKDFGYVKASEHHTLASGRNTPRYCLKRVNISTSVLRQDFIPNQ